MTRGLVLGWVLLSFTAGLLVVSAQDASLYTGVRICKMCHKKPEEGDQYGKWSASSHAKAFDVLASPEAKETAAKLGVDDPQKSGKCLKCHSMAYNFTEEVMAPDIPVEEGVSCESCHGPGKNYKKKETMQDRQQSIANGMVYPSKEKSCTRCHNEQSPTWKPDRFTKADGTKTGFDPDAAYEQIKHEVPK